MRQQGQTRDDDTPRPAKGSKAAINQPCPVCKRAMRLAGRERHRDIPGGEMLTFECSCGHSIALPTNQ